MASKVVQKAKGKALHKRLNSISSSSDKRVAELQRELADLMLKSKLTSPEVSRASELRKLINATQDEASEKIASLKPAKPRGAYPSYLYNTNSFKLGREIAPVIENIFNLYCKKDPKKFVANNEGTVTKEGLVRHCFPPKYYDSDPILNKFIGFLVERPDKKNKESKQATRQNDTLFQMYLDLINGNSTKDYFVNWGFPKKVSGYFPQTLETSLNAASCVWYAYVLSRCAKLPGEDKSLLSKLFFLVETKFNLYPNLFNATYVRYIQSYLSFLVAQAPALRRVESSTLMDMTDFVREQRPDPDYFAGRTFASVKERSDRWHAENRRRRVLDLHKPSSIGPIEWANVYLCKAAAAPDKKDKGVFHTYVFKELVTPAELEVEGNTLGHCVGGYWKNCYQHGTHIVSMALYTGEKVKSSKNNDLSELHEYGTRTLTLEITGGQCVQCRGKFNRNPYEFELAAVRMWAHTQKVKLSKSIVARPYDKENSADGNKVFESPFAINMLKIV